MSQKEDGRYNTKYSDNYIKWTNDSNLKTKIVRLKKKTKSNFMVLSVTKKVGKYKDGKRYI